jgi:hypothetical protein
MDVFRERLTYPKQMITVRKTAQSLQTTRSPSHFDTFRRYKVVKEKSIMVPNSVQSPLYIELSVQNLIIMI